jgi:hypothetical protein
MSGGGSGGGFKALTMHNEHDAFADGWGDPVGGDAQVRPHLLPAHPSDVQYGTVDASH